MLYKKKNESVLRDELFRHPTAEYRGAPFWAWNCALDRKELFRQLDILKTMGFGGAHMHVRTGMATPYLSDEYMALIRDVVMRAKENGMLAYLYDEDRWPSGAAGGLVTKDPEFRERYLLFTPHPYGSGVAMVPLSDNSSHDPMRTENGRLIACYDVKLDANGYLLSSKKIEENAPAEGEKWYAYLEFARENGWFNNQTYINTLDKKAMDRFIEVTYEAYDRTVSDEFDKTVPSIFTDEPQFARKQTLKYATDKKDVILPWTDDLPETFRAKYQEDLLAGMPELFWDRADHKTSLIRYHYHDHICERFTEAFADNCGAWCRAHNLKLTGHMDEEPTLQSQTAVLGEAMRAYRSFDIPGIDMLCARLEYTTAKQAQSAVHQYGREGMMSELYGVTNWDFDFRGHKLHGDWQAALGVTLRVPHLAWVSMGGSAKRDYPASLNYQSPWWQEYGRIEDHFARVNTALTRGKPIVRVGVIHPIESYWLHWGPSESTSLAREELDQNFKAVTEWLLLGGIDFDFISESLLPELCPEDAAVSAGENSLPKLKVGEMAYDAVLVPGCETLRKTTLDRLETFQKAGGRLIFAGKTPVLEDAVESSRAEALADASLRVPFTRGSILSALSDMREIEIRDSKGALTDNLVCQYRQDTDGRFLFIAHAKEPYNKDVSSVQDLRIRVKGNWNVKLFDTMSGEIRDIAYTVENGHTDIFRLLYDYDSLLLKLTPTDEASVHFVPENEKKPRLYQNRGILESDFNDTVGRLELPDLLDYELSEPNVVLLDQAEWKLDGGEWQPKEEVLRIDNLAREKVGYPKRNRNIAQPWCVPEEVPEHRLTLKFRVFSEIALSDVLLAVEDVKHIEIYWNGMPVEKRVTGFYVDHAIETLSLPGGLKAGENELIITLPLGHRTETEWCYLLGDFGVKITGRSAVVTKRPEKIAFGDIVSQGFPFYGGNLIYRIPVEVQGNASESGTSSTSLHIRSGKYRGVLQTVSLDDSPEKAIFLPPYQTTFKDVPAGQHELKLKVCGHRRNAFGQVHLSDEKETWLGPDSWRSVNDCWTYDYELVRFGVLNAPIIRET